MESGLEAAPLHEAKRRQGWHRWRKWFVTAGLAGLAAGLAIWYVVPHFVPLPPGLTEKPPMGLWLLDRDGKPLRRLPEGDLRADTPATYDEFPASLIQATIAAEDAHFFSHGGIDFRGILRAVIELVTHGHFMSGGSTITQQTVKLYSPPRRRNLRTKLYEALAARRVEMEMVKESILTAYLNHLPYGNQFTGPRAAAMGYFGKPLSDLSLGESALLAALPNKPTRLNPRRNLEGAMRRQRWVLLRMHEEGYISDDDLAHALTNGPKLFDGKTGVWHAPHFLDMVRARESSAVAQARATGIPLRTTLDLPFQHFVENAVSAELARLFHFAKEDGEIQAAVVVIENATGEIRALSGSRSYFRSVAGQINGAWRPRSAGSTLKPFTYVLALQGGATAGTILADTPIEYITPSGAYQPVNFDRRFRGPVSLRDALATSLNIPAVKTLDLIGGPERLFSCLVSDLHFTSLAPQATEYGLGLTIGNAEVRLLELVNGYATLARLGVWKPVRFVIPQPEPPAAASPEARVFSPDSCWLIADILSDARARAPAFGLNSPLTLPFRTAAKTGTSTDFRDSWTVGYTPDFTVGVWVGRFDNRPLRQITGSIGAGPIYHQIMLRLYRDREPTWYERPAGLVEVEVDRLSGKRPPKGLTLPVGRTRKEVFLSGKLPPQADKSDYDHQMRTRLPVLYSTWWRAEGNPLRSEAFLESVTSETSATAFRIVSPLDGTVAFLDPDLPAGGRRFPLRIAGSGGEEIEWSSPTLEIERKGTDCWLILQPGEHEVTATDSKSGRTVHSHLRVDAL